MRYRGRGPDTAPSRSTLGCTCGAEEMDTERPGIIRYVVIYICFGNIKIYIMAYLLIVKRCELYGFSTIQNKYYYYNILCT